MINSLHVAQSGLNASKVAVENISNNIANENTPGYKKRVVQLSEINAVDSSITGRGVTANESYRITSEYMFNNMMKENTKSNYYEEISSMVGNIEQMFQETDTSGFSKDLDRFFQAVENLRSNPSSEIYKTTVKTEGSTLVNSLQNLYSSIEQQEEITYNSLEDNVDEINSILKDIVELNKQIENQTSASNDLLDKRDLLEQELSALVDIEVDRSDDAYQLKIGDSFAIGHSTTLKEVNLLEDNTSQIDRFVTTDSNNFPIDSISDTVSLTTDDTITYKFNNEYEVTVTLGQSTYTDGIDNDGDGNPDTYDIDIDGDGSADTVTVDNYIRALEYAINNNSNLSEKVEAYNGNYTEDENGNKTDTTDSDKFLVIESKIEGTDGSFEGRIIINSAANGNEALFKDDYQSVDANNKVYLAIYDSEVELSSGTVKAQVENLTTDSINNKIVDYKNKLDEFAMTLSDIYDTYVEVDDEYLYGDISVDSYNGTETINELNLFSGLDVMSLTFNETAVNDLTQDDLNYLSDIQWKEDVDFDGFAQDASTDSKTSFSDFYQEIRVNISSDKENNDFFMETQSAVLESLEYSYDQLTKVDSDEEMVNLIQFQAAYSANAKIITVVDEMLQTLLNIR